MVFNNVLVHYFDLRGNVTVLGSLTDTDRLVGRDS